MSKEMERLAASAADVDRTLERSDAVTISSSRKEEKGDGYTAAPSLDALQSLLHNLTVYMKIVPAFDGVVDLGEPLATLSFSLSLLYVTSYVLPSRSSCDHSRSAIIFPPMWRGC